MSHSDPRHQTLSFLQRRFAEVGIEPRTRHGQNFLIDLNLVRLLVDSAKLDADDIVLEIGTGTGSLTGLLADRAAEVMSVEIDPRMHQLASEELFGRQNVTLLAERRPAQQEPSRSRSAGAAGRAAGGPARRGVETGRQSSLQRGHADPHQSAGVRHAAGNDDRHHPKGTGRADHGRARHEGLRRAEHLDSKPMPRGVGAAVAAERVLAAAESDVGHPAHRARRSPAGSDRRSGVLSLSSSARCSCTAANSCAAC